MTADQLLTSIMFWASLAAWGAICVLVGMWATTRFHEARTYVPRDEFLKRAESIQNMADSLDTALERLREDMASLKRETQQLRESTGELSAQAWESHSSLTELQPSLKDLEERVNLLRSWAAETARTSEVLVGLEPVLIYLAGGERPSRVSRHLAARMADVREWHQADACDVGVLIERLRDLGDEMRAGLAAPAQSDSL